MSCPNCNAEMDVVNYNNQIILHCSNCGGSFFEENGINRISQETAYALSQNKKSDEISGQEKKCPKDQTVLQPIPTDYNRLEPILTAIPSEVTLLQCSTCKGVFAFPDDLLKFKKAQDAKLSYFKTWGIPLPSLRAVVVLSFIALISAVVFSRFFLFEQGSLGQSQAADLIKNVSFSKSGRYGFVSFKTAVPVRSYLVITNAETGKTVAIQISRKPAVLHYATITDLSLTTPLTYHIVLVDEKGKEVKTEERNLDIK